MDANSQYSIYVYAGFFGDAQNYYFTISNVAFENPVIKVVGAREKIVYAGALAGGLQGDVSNISVTGGSVEVGTVATCSSSMAGGVAGQARGALNNVTVTGMSVSGRSEMSPSRSGGVIGSFEGESIKNVSVSNSNVSGVAAGGVTGYIQAYYAGDGVIENVQIKNLTVASVESSIGDSIVTLGGIVGMGQFRNDVDFTGVEISGLTLKNETTLKCYLGGVSGKIFYVRNSGNLQFDNFSVKSADIQGGTFMGGFFGYIENSPFAGSASSVAMEGGYFSGTISNANSENPQIGGFLGALWDGMSVGKVTIKKSVVEADVTGSLGTFTYYPSTELFSSAGIGGFIGALHNANVDLEYSYHIGNVTAPGSDRFSSTNIGYLVGNVNDCENIGTVIGNYHVGSADASTVKGVGCYDDWETGNSEIRKNVRNSVNSTITGAATLTDNGQFQKTGATGTLRNVVLADADMKKDALAYGLSETGAQYSRDPEGTLNNGYPIFASDEYPAFSTVTIRFYQDYPSFYLNGPFPEPEIPENLEIDFNGPCGTGCAYAEFTTGFDHKLPQSALEKLMAYENEYTHWVGSVELSAETVYEDNLFYSLSYDAYYVKYRLCTKEGTCSEDDYEVITSPTSLSGYEAYYTNKPIDVYNVYKGTADNTIIPWMIVKKAGQNPVYIKPSSIQVNDNSFLVPNTFNTFGNFKSELRTEYTLTGTVYINYQYADPIADGEYIPFKVDYAVL